MSGAPMPTTLAAATATPAARAGRRGRFPFGGWLQGNAFIWLVPGIALMLAVFIRPILLIVQESFTDPSFGLENYRTLASDPL